MDLLIAAKALVPESIYHFLLERKDPWKLRVSFALLPLPSPLTLSPFPSTVVNASPFLDGSTFEREKKGIFFLWLKERGDLNPIQPVEDNGTANQSLGAHSRFEKLNKYSLLIIGFNWIWMQTASKCTELCIWMQNHIGWRLPLKLPT